MSFLAELGNKIRIWANENYANISHNHNLNDLAEKSYNSLTDKPTSMTPTAHNHSATEITSGTLVTARGGTNQTSWTANRLAYANSTTQLSSLAAITASRALISNASGLPTHSTVTSTELEYLSGASSSLQTQINNRSLTTHNHNLNDLTEKSYNSLADKPDLSKLSVISNTGDGNMYLANDGTYKSIDLPVDDVRVQKHVLQGIASHNAWGLLYIDPVQFTKLVLPANKVYKYKIQAIAYLQNTGPTNFGGGWELDGIINTIDTYGEATSYRIEPTWIIGLGKDLQLEVIFNQGDSTFQLQSRYLGIVNRGAVNVVANIDFTVLSVGV